MEGVGIESEDLCNKKCFEKRIRDLASRIKARFDNSKGDLKSYMIQYRKDFEQSLHELDLTGKIDDNDSQSKYSHDVKLLYRWTYQVRY